MNNCASRHNALLHGAQDGLDENNQRRGNPTRTNRPEVEETEIVEVVSNAISVETATLLSVFPVKVEANDRIISTLAFVNSRSERSFIRQDLADDLSLEGPIFRTVLTTVNGTSEPMESRRVGI